MKNNLKKSLIAGAICAAFAMPVMADSYIIGHSINKAGESLSGVVVTVKNKATGLTRTVTTDTQGNYRFPLLPAGNYSLEAKKNGFTILKQDTLRVGSTGSTKVDLTLENSDVERITVTGAVVSSIDVTSSESQLVVDVDYLNIKYR
jgi:hypothetical protein